jgi:hypothetical protein
MGIKRMMKNYFKEVEEALLHSSTAAEAICGENCRIS